MPRKMRKSISVKGLTYFRLQRLAEERGVGIGGLVEEWARENMLKKHPPQPHILYEVRTGLKAGTSKDTMIHVVAPSVEKATMWAEMELQAATGSLIVMPSQRPFNPDKITYAHIGVVNSSELAEICR